MKTYTLTENAKKQILKENKLSALNSFDIKNCSDSEFFNIINDLK